MTHIKVADYADPLWNGKPIGPRDTVDVRRFIPQARKPLPPKPEKPQPPGAVTLVDIRVPFWRLVAFLLKLALASIPALLLFALIVNVVVGLFWGGLLLAF